MTLVRTYLPLSIGLHWAMAAMIVALVAVGFVLDELPKGDLRSAVFNIHKLTGVVAFALVAVRLAWRAGHPPPPSNDIPEWQQAAAIIVVHVSAALWHHFGRQDRTLRPMLPQGAGG